MQLKNRWLATGLVLACLPISACGKSSAFDSEAAENEGPAKIEEIKGSDYSQVTLTAQASKRLGIETSRVATRSGASGRTTVPYAAVLYDPQGNAFTYTTLKPLVFVRSPLKVDFIRGGVAYLKSGPPVGTKVVTVGSAELLGTEYGVEE